MTTAVDPAEETAADAGEGWRRLSPRMLAVHPVMELRRLIFPLLAVLIGLRNGSGVDGGWWALGIGALGIGLGFLRYFTTSFRITPTHVQVRRGLLRRRVLTVPRDRIRTVDVTSNVLHRIFGLARVTVGTGRTDMKSDGVKLDGLSAAAAENLHRELLHRPPVPSSVPPSPLPASSLPASSLPASSLPGSSLPSSSPLPASPLPASPVADAGSETTLATLDPAWIRYGPFTLSGLVAIGVLFGLGSRLVNESHIDPAKIGVVHDSIGYLRDQPLPLAILVVAAAVVVFTTIASTIGYVLTFWNFRLSRHSSGTLHVRRGLLTTRNTTIEERRLRGVELSEPLLLRSVHGARVLAIATGLRVGRGGDRGGSVLLPPAPRAVAVDVAGTVIGDADPLTVALTPHGPRARLRRFTRAGTVSTILILVALATVLFADAPAWVFWSALVLLPLGLLLALDRAASLGHSLSDHWLVSRFGSLVRRRYVLRTDAVIGWNMSTSVFQRRVGLTTLVATTAGGHQHYAIPDVPDAEALRVARTAVPGLLDQFLADRPVAPVNSRPVA
ncbi:PH domain-containing protein [Paractinoplanes globisporus]|uniref:PH domain-containing protein n=1 Tax=Paractinoplanes globisporus TaxID=113565 RepID=A0ABW6WA49_9ACTN|nr:PH domain-containing protein [Actinoplanes globisporus]